VEVALCPCNKLLQPFLHLAMRSGDGLVISYLIRCEVSFESSDLGDEGFCPYPGFFGTVVGNDVLSGEALERYDNNSHVLRRRHDQWSCSSACAFNGSTVCRC